VLSKAHHIYSERLEMKEIVCEIRVPNEEGYVRVFARVPFSDTEQIMDIKRKARQKIQEAVSNSDVLLTYERQCDED
jgi:hypothetical protein